MTESFARRITEDDRFESFILGLIVLNALTMGLETSATLVEYYDDWFYGFFVFSQIVFVIEIALRLFAHAPKFADFFKTFWNTFDFTIVVLSLIPAAGPFAFVARLARVLRVARIFSASKKLRLFTENIAESFEVIGFSCLVLGVIFYGYAIAGYHTFSETAAETWGTLWLSLQTLGQLAFFNGLVNLIESHSLWAPIFAFSFIFLFWTVLINMISATTRVHLTATDKDEEEQ